MILNACENACGRVQYFSRQLLFLRYFANNSSITLNCHGMLIEGVLKLFVDLGTCTVCERLVYIIMQHANTGEGGGA